MAMYFRVIVKELAHFEINVAVEWFVVLVATKMERRIASS